MAFVTIQRGRHTTKVSRNSYEKLFRDKGYKIVGEHEKKEQNETIMEDIPEEVEEDEKEQEEIETIPVSEMNKEQLMEFAKEHGIDTSSARNVREARNIIQKAIRESKM